MVEEEKNVRCKEGDVDFSVIFLIFFIYYRCVIDNLVGIPHLYTCSRVVLHRHPYPTKFEESVCNINIAHYVFSNFH